MTRRGHGDPERVACNRAWRSGRISDHNAVIGHTLVNILAGGALPHRTNVSERIWSGKHFSSYAAEGKALEQIQHALKTGKTLRN